MPFSATKDSEFGDSHYDISKTEKRLIRATFKIYEKTGTYVFLKLFKKVDDDYEFQQQRLSLTTEEFDKLIKKAPKIRETFPLSSQEAESTDLLLLRKQNLAQHKKVMVEAMFERSPSYFKQFHKQFKFLVTNEKINWSSVKNCEKSEKSVPILIQNFVS